MYLFVFFWTPALQDATDATKLSRGGSLDSTSLPYGLIFSNFMAAMMAGSLLFNYLMRVEFVTQVMLLRYVFLAAGASFLLALVFADSEGVVYAAFCVFEACVGMYYPCMAYLKGVIIEDGKRAATYAVMRIPLNVFVVGALAVKSEGAAGA